MKKTVIVMTHQENHAAPMAADEARVSIVRIAQTVKRTRSHRPRTRSRTGTGSAAVEAGFMNLGASYRKSRCHSDFRPRLAALEGRVVGSFLFAWADPDASNHVFDQPQNRPSGAALPRARGPAKRRRPEGSRPLHAHLRRERAGGPPDRRGRQRPARLRRGNRDPERRPRQPGSRPGGRRPARELHAHLLQRGSLRGLRRPGREAERHHAGRARQEDPARQQRRRGARERRQDRPPRDRARGRRRLRARLPRPHAAHDDA